NAAVSAWRAVIMSPALIDPIAPLQSAASGNSVIIVAEPSFGSEMTKWMSRSSSCLNSTTLAVTEKTVSSVGAIREDLGRFPGAGTARRSATVDCIGAKLTLPTSESLRVFTGQRSSPHLAPTSGTRVGGGVNGAV